MMKKTLTFIIGFGLLITCFGCNNNNIENIYGKYTFEEVSYLSPLSSSSINSENEMMKGMEFTIEANQFIGGTKYNPYELSSPEYRREKITDQSSLLSDIHSVIGKEARYQYTIYMKSGALTHFRLYVSSEGLWIASYAVPPAGDMDIIMYIYKLSKK
jgi:hypothetical protein